MDINIRFKTSLEENKDSTKDVVLVLRSYITERLGNINISETNIDINN